MDTYLLLRSNKQSGPYSLQQLVNFGLKPYDLVWVEGRSAAWRYPSEVEDLPEGDRRGRWCSSQAEKWRTT